jgi:hypothetical protein
MINKILILLTILMLATSSFAQDELAGYEIMDNLQIGLDVAPFEKWGVATADIDRNGWPDIFTIRWASPGYSRLYLNNNGIYTDITPQTPLESIEANESHTTTVSIVDFDNDGDRDIFFGTDTHIYLLRNDDNNFTDIAQAVGLTAGAPGFVNEYQFRIGVWADYDLDGDLDVVMGQQNNDNLLFYKNEGGTFVDIASELGFTGIAGHQGSLDVPTQSRRTRHLAWIDFDMDGDPDLNVGDLIYQNDNGTFTDITEATAFNPGQIEGAVWFDYDNDGDLDYFKESVTGYTCELWENQDGVMVDLSLELGVHVDDSFRGVTVGDYENDGDLDIFVQNNNNAARDVLFLNEDLGGGDRAFADVAEWIGLDKLGDRKGAAFFDYDMDGFLDIYVATAEHNHIMYHNLTLPTNNWVGFILEGTESNRDAIGTWVKLYAGEKMQVRYTQAPNSWVCQDNPYVHFGIGTATSVDSVIFEWPLGQREVLRGLEINHYITIKEGEVSSSVSKKEHSIPMKYSLEQNFPNPFNPQTTIRYSIGKPGEAQIIISNIMGEEVKRYSKFFNNAGSYSIEWNVKDKNGKELPSGLYLYRLETSEFTAIRKMLLIR